MGRRRGSQRFQAPQAPIQHIGRPNPLAQVAPTEQPKPGEPLFASVREAYVAARMGGNDDRSLAAKDVLFALTPEIQAAMAAHWLNDRGHCMRTLAAHVTEQIDVDWLWNKPMAHKLVTAWLGVPVGDAKLSLELWVTNERVVWLKATARDCLQRLLETGNKAMQELTQSTEKPVAIELETR